MCLDPRASSRRENPNEAIVEADEMDLPRNLIAALRLPSWTERRPRVLVLQTEVARGARKAVEAMSVQSLMMWAPVLTQTFLDQT